MRQYIWIALLLLLNACSNNNTQETTTQTLTPKEEEKPNFIRITSFLKGEVVGMTDKMQPKKYVTINEHTDSSFLKFEDLDNELKDFMQPVIDSANLSPLFAETKFVDQTINAITFTYDPKGKLPDSMPLRHWDVYVDPEKGKITRVYMVKKLSGNKTQQLTWQSGQWCKITTIVHRGDTAAVEKEEKISWDY